MHLRRHVSALLLAVLFSRPALGQVPLSAQDIDEVVASYCAQDASAYVALFRNKMPPPVTDMSFERLSTKTSL